MNEEKIVMSLGGSLVIPEEIDVAFLVPFKNLLLKEIGAGKHFYIIVGGGKVCRKYQHSASEISNVSNEDLDIIGIHSCLLNGTLVRSIFGDMAHGKLITDMDELKGGDISAKVVILGPNKPGHSSDLGAVQIAEAVGAKKILNLSNTDYVYDSDPKINPNAKKIESISWAEYRSLIPREWNPGLSSPFDPVASELADREGMEVVIMNGKPISNLENYLNGEKFEGTIIS